MHRYFIQTPWWVKKIYPSYLWNMHRRERTVYLTFDDGPHPTITPWVLEQLAVYDATATFFCIGDNVVKYPDVFNRLMAEGHAIGNHTQHHLNGWKTKTKDYLKDVAMASQHVSTNLFRPPYGRITRRQARGLDGAMKTNSTVVMWDVLSGDFDATMSEERCVQNVIQNTKPGSVVVFHDSEKAFKNLKICLPDVLKHLREEGYKFEKIIMRLP